MSAPFKIIGTETLESYDIINVRMRDSIVVAKRPIPKNTSGEKIDYDTYVHHPTQLEVVVRLSTTEKATFETIFNANQKVTVELNSDTGKWTFSQAWIEDKNIHYVHSISLDGTDRSWETRLVIFAESASFVAV